METVVVLLILGLFVINLFIMRSFFKKIGDKITFINTNTTTTTVPTPSIPIDNPLFRKQPDGTTVVDAPATNTVLETDGNEIEFNEQTFNFLPGDLKVEVEGGDTNVPPEFDEKEDKV